MMMSVSLFSVSTREGRARQQGEEYVFMSAVKWRCVSYVLLVAAVVLI